MTSGRFIPIALLSLLLAPGASMAGTTTEIDGSVQLGQLGASLDGIGDIDFDGFDEFIAGAPGVFNSTGAAYVFDGATNGVIAVFTGEFEYDRFGTAVAGIGDVTGDFVPDFAVGAPTHDTNGDASGRVYVYSGFDLSLLYTLDGPIAGARFGEAIEGLTDIDFDLRAEFAVGAPEGGFSPPGGPSMSANGAVFVYRGFDVTPLFSIAGASSGDRFGSSIARLNDVNSDFVNDFAVGAPRADVTLDETTYIDAGRVYVISGRENPDGSPDGSRLLQVLGNPTHVQAFAYFGTAISRVADFEDDHTDELAVGAPDAGPAARGRVFVYASVGSPDDGDPESGEPFYDPHGSPFFDALFPWVLMGDEFSGDFGASVAGLANLRRHDENTTKAEAMPEIAVGDPGATNPHLIGDDGTNAGRAWIFDGYSVAIDGIGDPGDAFFTADGQRNGDRLGAAVSARSHASDYGMAQALIGAPDVDFFDPPQLANAGKITVYQADRGSILYYGRPCATPASPEVHLEVSGNPAPGGLIQFEVQGAPFGMLFLIFDRHQASYPGSLFGSPAFCGLHIDLAGAEVIHGVLDATGTLSISAGLPPDAAFGLVIQAAVEDPQGGIAASRAVELRCH